MRSGMRERLDLVLVSRGIAPTRARARDAILRGAIQVDGKTVSKPAALVSDQATIDAFDPAGRYVSRAALKLIAGLDHFGYAPAGLHVLDIGASTGGFTDVLVERGAARVYAIDVGHDQLHRRLRGHPMVRVREGLNARDLTAEHIHGRADAIVADVSFISLRLALPPALVLAEPGAWGVFLVKPQFEVGREGIGKGGIVRDPSAARGAADDLVAWLERDRGWRVDGLIESPLAGGSGNREYLVGARKDMLSSIRQ
ncbi:MAG: TlyA family RNA methyltransferase [Hyphomicrobiales bacterium]|nr:TlyA family RNA methyltransferase [Hyphomicrobiales bacterium]